MPGLETPMSTHLHLYIHGVDEGAVLGWLDAAIGPLLPAGEGEVYPLFRSKLGPVEFGVIPGSKTATVSVWFDEDADWSDRWPTALDCATEAASALHCEVETVGAEPHDYIIVPGADGVILVEQI